MHRTSALRATVLFLAGSLGALACSSAAGPSLDPTHTNCNIVCEQEGKCGPSGFDVDGCESSCDTKSGDDDTYKASVNDCATCVNGASCSDSLGCVDNCLSTVTGS
jgi:hypothetical protein